MNNEQKDFFSNVLADPGLITAAHAEKLGELVDHYPQAGVLHALLALAYKNTDQHQFLVKLQTASTYSPDRPILYRLVNQTEAFFPHLARQTKPIPAVAAEVAAEPATIAPNDNRPFSPADQERPVEHEFIKPQQVTEQKVNFFHIPNESPEGHPDQLTGADDEPGLQGSKSIEFSLTPGDKPRYTAEFDTITNEQLEELKQKAEAKHFSIDDGPVFDFSMDKLTGDRITNPKHFSINRTNAIDDERVTKYHDDKMPYTFMWWLDKTRKEHSSVYQPYINTNAFKRPDLKTVIKDDLQKQYYENIFHLTTVDELEKNEAGKAPAQFGTKRKASDIIENFIQKEPQIQPPSTEKLDNENKASKSAEDHDEIISETLARIYTDQMLYHKAIATYQKLILKYPEKRTYFAGKIELLETKLNK